MTTLHKQQVSARIPPEIHAILKQAAIIKGISRKNQNYSFLQLKEQVSHLSNQTSEYLKDKFEPRISGHLKSLEDYLNHYPGVLNDGMKSSELNQADKTVLKNRLEKLSQEQTIMKQDISVVKSAAV